MGRRTTGRGALAGVAAATLGAGVGELVAALLTPGASPFAAIGSALIDLAPPWAKDAAIALFGTNDKVALLVGIGVVLVAASAGAGALEARRPPLGRTALLALGVVGAVAAMTRADSGLLSFIPSAAAALAASGVLWWLVRLLPSRVWGAERPLGRTPRAPEDGSRPKRRDGQAGSAPKLNPAPAQTTLEGPSRRVFLAWTGSAAALGVLTAIGGAALRAGTRTVEAIRSALRLPAPALSAPPVAAGAELEIPGLASVITPNDGFYRIDTALLIPQIDPADWRLRVHGLVEREVELTWDELVALPLEESITTLTCVSNEVGGDLIGTARWLGYPIRELLARARPTTDADMVLSRSIDGFTASTPIEVLTDDRNAILAIGMNGEPLPARHGFPARMVVPGLYGYVSATKWVVELEVTRFDRATAYWTDRGWAERAPVKLQSRIDVPRRGQGLRGGDTVIAGVAWQQYVGISGVEVQVDDEPWRPATLATAISDDTWVQWSLPWTATAGFHVLRCRATNADGAQQTSDRERAVPDGATGWHEMPVDVF